MSRGPEPLDLNGHGWCCDCVDCIDSDHEHWEEQYYREYIEEREREYEEWLESNRPGIEPEVKDD